jgi:hypothetical protein
VRSVLAAAGGGPLGSATGPSGTLRKEAHADDPLQRPHRKERRRGDPDRLKGRGDAIFTKPDDKTKPITAEFDSNYDGKIDIIVLDRDRDGRWDVSYYDTDHDGKIDLVGYHPDGNIKASRYEKYVENKSARKSKGSRNDSPPLAPRRTSVTA